MKYLRQNGAISGKGVETRDKVIWPEIVHNEKNIVFNMKLGY